MIGPAEKRTPGGNRANAEGSAGNAPILALHPVDVKRFATAQARAALLRHTLIRVGDGFILGRYTYTKHCADLDAVEALLDRMGAPQ